MVRKMVIDERSAPKNTSLRWTERVKPFVVICARNNEYDEDSAQCALSHMKCENAGGVRGMKKIKITTHTHTSFALAVNPREEICLTNNEEQIEFGNEA